MRIERTTSDSAWERVTPAHIAGPVVTLRHISLGFTREEILRQFRWGQDTELQYWSGSVPTAPSFAQFEADVATWSQQRDARRDRYAIVLPDHGLIGMISYYNINADRQSAELGIYIGDRAFWGKGIGTEAILTLLAHLFTNAKLQAMHLTTYAANGRAQSCYRKCGFEVTGTVRKFSGRIGYYVDVQMKITRDTFMRHFADRPIVVYPR